MNVRMIKVFGPANPKRIAVAMPDGSGFTSKEGTPVETGAEILGEAIKAYEEKHAVTIAPYDGSLDAIPFEEGEEPKYFFYSKSALDRRLVDIHVFRNGQEICPKQNLSFVLMDGDIIQVGELVC